MNPKALYYPYIHIQDVNWLKATLLLFSEVRRMMPVQFTPEDSDEIRAFALGAHACPPLLSPANLWTPRAEAAQEELANRLRADATNPEFRLRFGPDATRQSIGPGDFGFQIHQEKLAHSLREALRDTELAWQPYNPERYDPYAEYIELHPRVGQAVMSTLAVAAATGEGLDIVGDLRSGLLHQCLLEKDANGIYEAWLHPSAIQPAPSEPKAEELFEFLVGFACDMKNVTPDQLATLQEDREPLRKLVTQLRNLTAQIPAMDPGPERETYFRDIGTQVLKEWKSDRSNMSAYWRKFFGDGKVADDSQKFARRWQRS